MHELRAKAVKAAAHFLDRRGYEIVEKDWESEGGREIDLVAKDGDTMVFVDVRARLGVDRGMPEGGGEASRERREAAAAAWLSEHGDEAAADMAVRFDDIAMMALGEDRALLRHHVNCLGAGCSVAPSEDD